MHSHWRDQLLLKIFWINSIIPNSNRHLWIESVRMLPRSAEFWQFSISSFHRCTLLRLPGWTISEKNDFEKYDYLNLRHDAPHRRGCQPRFPSNSHENERILHCRQGFYALTLPRWQEETMEKYTSETIATTSKMWRWQWKGWSLADKSFECSKPPH